MFAIIENIPKHITSDDLEMFVVPALDNSFFFEKSCIEALKIIKLVDGAGKQIERHGIVRLSPENAARHVIKSLNGQLIGGKHVYVHEYIIRSWHNDRRTETSNPVSQHKDKRKADRRREGLHKVSVSEKLICNRHL